MSNAASIPRLMIAGTSSGVGKTTLAAGLIVALRRRGLVVQPFKCGPDYIDPSYHTQAAGRPCRNLDSWMLDDGRVVESFQRACHDADLAVIEGVMGLFDGCDFEDERASAAQVAKLLGAPVLLVLDISGAARSAAALAMGFARFDSALRVEACALNFAGSATHAAGCGRAIASAGGPTVVGWLPRQDALRVPERHLGLVPSGERREVDSLLAAIADEIEGNFDLDAVLRLARSAETLPTAMGQADDTEVVPPENVCSSGGTGSVRSASSRAGDAPLIAVVRDEAFSFYYPDNLDLLEAAGARIAFFSPIKGELPPADAAGVYLGGGYPELHAAALASNTALWDDLRRRHRRGQPIWAECGGFMVLTEALVDRNGRRWPMAGLVPGITRMTERIAGIGYRWATAPQDNLLAAAGQTLRGHEFHYSVWQHELGLAPAWRVRGVRTNAPETDLGYARGSLLASYLHIHLGQDPRLARRLVERLRRPMPILSNPTTS